MLSIPTAQGTIRRRMLINYHADAEVVQALLPPVFRPKLHRERAIVGVCLIRLEQVRPQWSPLVMGMASENAAHRIAVLWDDEDGHEREGVYISRRDTGSILNSVAGGRLFPGQHHLAHFDASLENDQLNFVMRSQDGEIAVKLHGAVTGKWPETSLFHNLEESSAFFAGGSVGYSPRHESDELDGLRLETHGWQVQSLQLDEVSSSYFEDETRFPTGSIVFDHALLMQNLEHYWHAEPSLRSGNGNSVSTTSSS